MIKRLKEKIGMKMHYIQFKNTEYINKIREYGSQQYMYNNLDGVDLALQGKLFNKKEIAIITAIAIVLPIIGALTMIACNFALMAEGYTFFELMEGAEVKPWITTLGFLGLMTFVVSAITIFITNIVAKLRIQEIESKYEVDKSVVEKAYKSVKAYDSMFNGSINHIEDIVLTEKDGERRVDISMVESPEVYTMFPTNIVKSKEVEEDTVMYDFKTNACLVNR